jgi:glycosyltransferase involved in cell wall biosynthesis
MYVDICKTKKYTRYLLRDSFREDGLVKHHTVANLSGCSEEEIKAIQLALRHKGQLESLLNSSPSIELEQGLSVGSVWVVYQLARELGIADRVTFLGWQEREELVKKYNHANLFLFPSRHEGMPNALLEAMASGLPAIASRIAGNEELVLDGQTGLLFPAEDVPALRDALRALLTDASRRKAMGAAARARVEKGFAWSQVAEKYLSLLSALEKKG